MSRGCGGTWPVADSIPITSYFLRRIVSRSRARYAAELWGITTEGEMSTSPIVAIDGRRVTTRSGTIYELVGPPRWPGKDYDPTNPLAAEEVSFYLDADGAQTWPPGTVVPVLHVRHWWAE